MSTNGKKQEKPNKTLITENSQMEDLEEITRDFMNQGLSLKPTIYHCSPHNTTEGAVGDMNNPDLDSEIARLEKEEASLKKMLTLKQLFNTSR